MNWQDKDIYGGISEELLAAFDEGKTNAEETMMVLDALGKNEILQEEYFLSKQLDAMMEMETDDDVEVLPIMAMAAESDGNLCNFQCETYILQRRGITANNTQLFQSGKLSGVMSMTAAAPMSPVTTGLRPDIMPLNALLPANLAYTLQSASTMMNEGSTTAMVAVHDPSMHVNSEAPLAASTS